MSPAAATGPCPKPPASSAGPSPAGGTRRPRPWERHHVRAVLAATRLPGTRHRPDRPHRQRARSRPGSTGGPLPSAPAPASRLKTAARSHHRIAHGPSQAAGDRAAAAAAPGRWGPPVRARAPAGSAGLPRAHRPRAGGAGGSASRRSSCPSRPARFRLRSAPSPRSGRRRRRHRAATNKPAAPGGAAPGRAPRPAPRRPLPRRQPMGSAAPDSQWRRGTAAAAGIAGRCSSGGKAGPRRGVKLRRPVTTLRRSPTRALSPRWGPHRACDTGQPARCPPGWLGTAWRPPGATAGPGRAPPRPAGPRRALSRPCHAVSRHARPRGGAVARVRPPPSPRRRAGTPSNPSLPFRAPAASPLIPPPETWPGHRSRVPVLPR